MKKLYLDSETCGFHGLPVLLQYAYDDGPIFLYEVWKNSVGRTMQLLEEFMEHCLIGFNLSFDMFHLCKLYTIWSLLPSDLIPENDIRLVAETEPLGRDGPCVKPASCLDLMLYSRKGPYQCLMSRDPVRIRKVPTILAGVLAQELEKRVELDGILFAKRANPDAPRWQVYDRRNNNGDIDPDFKDVVLQFNPAGGLKFLAEYALEKRPDFQFTDIQPDTRPVEKGYVPFALGISRPEDDWQVWNTKGKLLGQAWPGIISQHIEHWSSNEKARCYAMDDVKYTRLLDSHFGYPEPNDDDSVLACMVAAVRWHGFMIDLEQARQLLDRSRAVLATAPVNINKPPQVRRYIKECLDLTESLLIDQSTKKANIEIIRDQMVVTEPGETCLMCCGMEQNPPCPRCNGRGELEVGPMPASKRASKILEVKAAAKEVELHSKIVEAGRFHASFKVIGALSARMSGADGLNAQGIKRSKEVRSMFPLAWDGMILCGGDFDSFEVVLADAVFEDPKLRLELLSGKKIHALMGVELYKLPYEAICDSKGKEFDMYSRAKQAVFALLYGGDQNTIHNKLSIELETAEEAFLNFQKRFPEIKRKRDEVFERFQALRQPNGIGSKIHWKDPADFSETFLGFRRYFNLENKVIRCLYDLAHRPPRHWTKIDMKVVRTNREQKVAGALMSAVYAAAFQLQAANTRAANNHLIQSPGAQITKNVQRRIWDIQPHGVNDWLVAPMNVHDEVMCVTHPSVIDTVANSVTEAVESYRDRVPLIAMDWKIGFDNWGDKDNSEAETVSIKPDKGTLNVGKDAERSLVEALDDSTVEGTGFTEWDSGLEDLASDEIDLDPLFS